MSQSRNCEITTIQSTIVRVAHEIDRKEWRLLRALYADEVDTDHSSLFGGTPQRQHGDDLIDGWRKALANVSTHHLLGPIDVGLSGSVATAECHVRAWHYAKRCPGGEEWVVGGHYVFGLAKTGETWRITTMTLTMFHESGNTKLLQQASVIR